jgi:hypothetical protein
MSFVLINEKNLDGFRYHTNTSVHGEDVPDVPWHFWKRGRFQTVCILSYRKIQSVKIIVY